MTRNVQPVWRSAPEMKLVEQWAAMGYATKTINMYLTAVRAADAWCVAHGHKLRTLSAIATVELAASVPKSWSSRLRLRSALNAYWTVTGRKNPPLKAIRVPSKPQMRSRALEEPAAAILEEAARLRGDRKGLAVLLGLYLGLRRAEIASLCWSDFDDELAWVTIVGKGDVTATLPVHPLLVSALKGLRKDAQWLFPGRFGKSVVPATIWDWSRQVAKEAQLGPVSTHVLRHTCLTTANDATGDLRAVQMFARHARPDTTAGYTRVATKRVISVMLSLDYHATEEAS